MASNDDPLIAQSATAGLAGFFAKYGLLDQGFIAQEIADNGFILPFPAIHEPMLVEPDGDLTCPEPFIGTELEDLAHDIRLCGGRGQLLAPRVRQLPQHRASLE